MLSFELGRWDVTDGPQQPFVVEPIHPFERGELDLFQVAPGATLSDDFGLEQADDGFGQCVVVGVADASPSRLFPIPA